MSRALDTLVSIWSIRPQPGTPHGETWERGAEQGWQWAIERCARICNEADKSTHPATLADTILKLKD